MTQLFKSDWHIYIDLEDVNNILVSEVWRDLYFHDLIFDIKNPVCVAIFIVHPYINIEGLEDMHQMLIFVNSENRSGRGNY